MWVYWMGVGIGFACGYLWGYRSAVDHLGGRLYPSEVSDE